jgi:hypothetical protein
MFTIEKVRKPTFYADAEISIAIKFNRNNFNDLEIEKSKDTYSIKPKEKYNCRKY